MSQTRLLQRLEPIISEPCTNPFISADVLGSAPTFINVCLVIIRLEIVFSFIADALSISSGGDFVGRTVRTAVGSGGLFQKGWPK